MWQLRKTAHLVLTDDGGAILDERTGRWTQLTPTSSAAVMLLLAGGSEDDAARQYAARYGIDADQAAKDIAGVASSLTERGIATTTTATLRSRWRWGR
ncbi:PqqD family peptide modification chaperone [Streptomyces decoyicus]